MSGPQQLMTGVGAQGLRTLLLLNFDDAANRLLEPISGQTFAIESSGSLNAGSLTSSGKFDYGYSGNGLVNASPPGGPTAALGMISLAASTLWDVASASFDFAISFWFQTNLLPSTSAGAVFQINESPYDSNNFVYAAVGYTSSGGGQFNCFFGSSIADNFLDSGLARCPYNSDWHFFVGARIGNTHYASVDGSAPVSGSSFSTSYRRSPAARTILIGSNSNTRQWPGKLDCFQLIRGRQYDVVNGFTPPTSPPGLI